MTETVHRTARITLRATPAQKRRCFGLMVGAGDVWAMAIDCNASLRRWGCKMIVDFPSLCRELAGMAFGELARICQEDVLKRYSAAWISAAKRRSKGEVVGFPRCRRRFFPVRFRKGAFALEGRTVRLATARGCPVLQVRLARPIPYPAEALRSVTLVFDAGRLCLDVTAEIPVTPAAGLDPDKVAGVDIGIIHLFAAACEGDGLLVSGRALRAEERLHLQDTKARRKKLAPKAPPRGQRGSRRYRRLRASQRRAEARHKRRIRQAQHQAAKELVSWAAARGIGTLVVGDLSGITDKDSGRHHNLRLRQWRRTHLVSCLRDKAERAGVSIKMVDERGSSSTCPRCGTRSKPSGRTFSCRRCNYLGHRDLVGARNIAATGGGHTSDSLLVTHRRAGAPPARRDRRRHLFDARRRSCLAPSHPVEGCRSSGETPARIPSAA